MPRTRAPCWGDISFTGTRLSTHRRRRGQAGLRDNTLSRTSYPDAAVEEAPEGVAAAPVGGGTWPGTPEPQAPPVWRAPEGPEGTGGLRGAAPNEVRTPSLAGGRALRRPEHQRSQKQRHQSGGPPPTGAQSSPAPRDARNTCGATSNATPQPGKARRSSPSEPCVQAGASRPGRSGCEPRCAAPRLRCR